MQVGRSCCSSKNNNNKSITLNSNPLISRPVYFFSSRVSLVDINYRKLVVFGSVY